MFLFFRGTFADLEQNLQNIMGVNKARTTTNPSTPTTAGTAPAFPQSFPDQEVIPEVPVGDCQPPVITSRFQVSPITDERPANLAFEPKGTTFIFHFHK